MSKKEQDSPKERTSIIGHSMTLSPKHTIKLKKSDDKSLTIPPNRLPRGGSDDGNQGNKPSNTDD